MAPQPGDGGSPVPELPPDATVRDAARAITSAGTDRAVITTRGGEREVVTAADVVQAVAEEKRLGSTKVLTISRLERQTAGDTQPATRLDAVLDLVLTALVVTAARPDGVSVLVHPGAARGTVAATSSDLHAVDQLQLDLAHGPAFEAMSTRTTQRVELRPSSQRWPNYHRAALAHGMRRTLCLPLVTDAAVVGAASLFWRDAGPFADEAERAAELVASRAARAIASTGALEALSSRHELGDTDDPAPAVSADDLPADETGHEVVTEAQDILRSRRQLSDEEALATLRDASQRTRRPIPDVAREVVDLPEYMRPKTK